LQIIIKTIKRKIHSLTKLITIFLKYLLLLSTHKRAYTNLVKISESMNHSDPRTTTLHYLDNFEMDSDIDVNDVLM